MSKNKLINSSGFSLVEMIVYVGIFSVIMVIIVQLSLQVQFAGSRTRLSTEIKENASQAMQLMVASVREGSSLNEGGSIFDQHPGRLVIDGAPGFIFETYTKQVQLADTPVTIRKLQAIQGGSSPLDITSDHVDVTNFQIKNMSHGGQPGTVQITLEVSSINPQNDPNYEQELELKTTAALRSQP